MDRRAILLLSVPLIVLVALSSFQLIEVTKLREELNNMREQLAASTRDSGQYGYISDWVTKFIGYNPIASTTEAKELYISLVN